MEEKLHYFMIIDISSPTWFHISRLRPNPLFLTSFVFQLILLFFRSPRILGTDTEVA